MITLNGVTTSPLIQAEGDFFIAEQEGPQTPFDQTSSFAMDVKPPHGMMFASGGGSLRKVTRKPSSLPEDRAARALERGMKNLPKKFSQSDVGKFLKRIFWREVDSSEKYFHRAQRLAHGTRRVHLHKTFSRHQDGSPLTEGLLQHIKPLIPKPWGTEDTIHIAEVGAGDGNFARIITQRTGAFVLEVDLFHPLSDLSRRVTGDLQALPISDERLDLVVSSFALEYVGEKAWREVRRVLKPGGHIVALTHHQKSTFAKYNPIMDKYLPGIYLFALKFRPLHLIFPTFLLQMFDGILVNLELQKIAYPNREAVIDLLKKAGFEDIEVEPLLTPHLLRPKSKKLLDHGFIVKAKKPNNHKRKKLA